MQLLAKFLLAKLTGAMGKKLFIALAEELALMTDTKVDDKLVKAIKKALEG
jgi:hypothetical protein